MTPGEKAGLVAAGYCSSQVEVIESLLETHAVWLLDQGGVAVRSRMEPSGPPGRIRWDQAESLTGLWRPAVIPKPVVSHRGFGRLAVSGGRR